MTAWERKDEACANTDDQDTLLPCRDRDTIRTELKSRGWCPDFPDRQDAMGQWQRCSLRLPGATKEPVEQDEAFETGMAAGGNQRNQQAVEKMQLHRSPALREAEEAIASASRDVGTADAIEACGVRGHEWASRIEHRLLKSYETSAEIDNAAVNLTVNEIKGLTAYRTALARAQKRFVMGAGTLSDCQQLAAMPFLSGFDGYASGKADTLPDGVGHVNSGPGSLGRYAGAHDESGSAEANVTPSAGHVTFGPASERPAALSTLTTHGHAWFPVLEISLHGEPMHQPRDGYLPKYDYPSRSACLAATRGNIGPMAQAGVHGRFLCMRTQEPDKELKVEPIERF
jgi:hypothetical protein